MVEFAPILPLTDNCHHYTRLKNVPWDIQKYWHQRYQIFPNYDDDIYLTDDAWFGVTPQPVAERIAQDLKLPRGVSPERATVVDLFAGAGGNAVAFALSGRWAHVVAIEKDADTLACAQNNAAVSGVSEDAITWVLGDCFEILPQLLQQSSSKAEALEDETAVRIDAASTVLFASPPWGGITYRDQPVFDLTTMEPYNLQALHDACYPLAHALYLPRTSDLQQIADVMPDADNIEVVQYCMKGASKALVAYYPAAANASSGY